MKSFQLLSPGERYASMFAAFVVSLAVLSATVLSFASDGNTPWFAAGSELAAEAAQHCDAATQSSQRHRCLREVAQASARQASAPTLLARH